MQIRQEFAQVIANQLVPTGQASSNLVSRVKELAETGAGQEIRTEAHDEVEINFERVAKVIAGASKESPEQLKAEAQPALDAFGNAFIYSFQANIVRDYESLGEGMFSFQGGNTMYPNATYFVDVSPGVDNIHWMMVDNSKLPHKN